MLDNGYDIIEMVFFDDFEDEDGGDFVKGDFVNVDEIHLVLSVGGFNSDVLHVFHAVVNVGDVDLDDVVDGELLQNVAELEQAGVLMIRDWVE